MLIKCPNCGESITLEQNVYDSIANEIRNEQFEKELEKRATSLIKEKESEIDACFIDSVSSKNGSRLSVTAVLSLNSKNQYLKSL